MNSEDIPKMRPRRGKGVRLDLVNQPPKIGRKQELYECTLFGFMDFFGVFPNFVFLVFQKGGKYYFANSSNGIFIDKFEKVNEKNIGRIQPIYNLEKRRNLKKSYRIVDELITAIQVNNNFMYIGSINEVLEFMEIYNLKDNELLRSKISALKDTISSYETIKNPNHILKPKSNH